MKDLNRRRPPPSPIRQLGFQSTCFLPSHRIPDWRGFQPSPDLIPSSVSSAFISGKVLYSFVSSASAMQWLCCKKILIFLRVLCALCGKRFLIFWAKLDHHTLAQFSPTNKARNRPLFNFAC